MKKKIEVEFPDIVIKMDFGDFVRIYKRKNSVLFDIFCDGAGGVFELTRKQMESLLK